MMSRRNYLSDNHFPKFPIKKLYFSSADEEKNAIEEFVKKNDYYSFNVFQKVLPIQEKSEYGDYNHVCCKLIYENIDNEHLVKKYIMLIRTRGGNKALLANYYTLCNWSPLAFNALTKSIVIAQFEKYLD